MPKLDINDGINEYAKAFAEVAADSDYSRYTKLQTASQQDIKAAAQFVWQIGNHLDPRKLPLDEESVIQAMLAQVKRYGDESELVSTEYQEYWDATDEMRFSSFLLDQMAKELTGRFLAAKRAEGYVVVNNDDGIRLFKVED